MFIIPVLLFSLHQAIIISIFIGFYLIVIISIAIARERDVKPWKMVLEHLFISFIVIILAHYAGDLIAHMFN
jgi:VIT1/CCC1 family predicted Fe2+/Mn2+ transporter